MPKEKGKFLRHFLKNADTHTVNLGVDRDIIDDHEYLPKFQRKAGIEMIGLNTKKWDADVLELVGETEYSKDVQSTLSEQ